MRLRRSWTHGDDGGGAGARRPDRRVVGSARPRARRPRSATTAWSAPRRRRAPRTGPTPTPRAASRAKAAASPATSRPTPHHAPLAGGGARLRRLPWRQSEGQRRFRAWRTTIPRYIAARDRAHVLPRYRGRLAFPVERQSGAHLHLAEPGIARVHPLHQPQRLSRRARQLRRLPYRGDRGGRALAHVVGRDAVGRRRLQ